jgi:hypothetical protein
MIVYFAPGNGRGHAVRAAAISRRLTQPVTAVVFPGWNESLALAGVQYVEADGIDAASEAARGLKPDLVVFDACDDFFSGFGAARSVYVNRADRCLAPEGRYVWDFSAEQPLPWALPAEVLDRAAARKLLGATTDLPLVASLKSWASPGGLDIYGAVVRNATAGIAEVITAPDVPASEWLAGVDLVFGTPGSNLYWEATGSKVPSVWWTIMESPRDQRVRVPGSIAGPSPARVTTALAGLIPSWETPPQEAITAIAAKVDELALGS